MPAAKSKNMPNFFLTFCLDLLHVYISKLSPYVLIPKQDLTDNGPAVGLSKRNPTQAPSRVQSPRASGARKLSRRAPRERSEQRGCKEGEPAPQQRSGGGGVVFAVRVQVL